MALPNNKQSLADWILRRLGAPVININVADIQLEDCIDEAVQMYQEYHFDGAQRGYRAIKVTNEMRAGNKRPPRGLTAPMYDQDYVDGYRKGDRVTTYDENQQPTKIWVKFDSEEKLLTFTYNYDSEGIYFAYYGTELDLVKTVLDSEHFDSEGGFTLYDSDVHNVFQYTAYDRTVDEYFAPVGTLLYDPDLYFFRDSDQTYYQQSAVAMTRFDSERYYERRVQDLFIDSDGVIVNYDSDKHVLATYDVLSFDSDPTTLGLTLYVDSENLLVTGNGLDSDENKVLYDSDAHTTITYQETTEYSTWVDSEGVKVLYDSDKHTTIRYDSDRYGAYIFDVGAPEFGQFVLYDSDTDSDGGYLWDGVTRFQRLSIAPTFYEKVTLYPIIYTKQERIPYEQLLKRQKVSLGNRFSREDSDTTIYKTFLETWKEEQKVLTEPQLNLDYSKEGQIGIPIPDSVIGVTKVFRIGQQSSVDMYNYEYQMFLNNFDFFYSGNGGNLSNYFTLKMNLEHIDFLLNTQPAIRFNKFKDRLYIDMDWSRAKVGDTLLAEVYEITDPEIWGKMYSDTWLKRYATALVKMQWGTNLRKYANVELPGGIVLNGQELYDEGKEEAEKLEETLKDHWGEMDSIIVG